MNRTNYRAPREHRTALIVPEPGRLPQVCQANRELLATYDFRLLGRPAQDVRRSARRALLSLPATCLLGRPPTDDEIDPDGPIILTGHQPALYHPGVWLKNFLAGHLARAVGGTPVNLNVDNDESHQLTIRAPVVDGDKVRVVEAAYLAPTGGLPYEELDGSLLLDGLGDRLREQGVDENLCRAVDDYWRGLDAARPRGALARVVACARHQLERQAGLNNMEAQVSDVARLTEFRLLVLDILARLPQFHAAYNGGLATFRRVHHEKNAAQPMPDLLREGQRWEMPFWVWRTGGHRQRLWATHRAEGVSLYLDGDDQPFVTMPHADLAAGGAGAVDVRSKGHTLRAVERVRRGGCPTVAVLAEQESRGVKIRPRALTLTLFARVFLGDVFIHGLGGAIYDKVTDEIIRTYFGVEPPQLVTATGTVLLPLVCFNARPDDRRRLLRRLRDIRYNPDRLMGATVAAQSEVRDLADRKRDLVDRKRDLIERRRSTPGERAAAWRELREVNARLASLMEDESEATRRELDVTAARLADNAVLRNREYPFVLHPRDELIAFYRHATAVPS